MKSLRKLLKPKPSKVEASSETKKPSDNIEKHKEEIFKEARKLIYPLAHSKNRIVVISTIIIVSAAIIFTLTSAFLVYQAKSESNFTYQVSRVVPFPMGKVGKNFLLYEEYLFELKRNKHFRSTQADVDFNTTEGQKQLEELRKEVLNQVIKQQLVENLAQKHELEVSEEEIEEQIAILRAQASFSLGTSNQEEDAERRFAQILEEFYDWSDKDLRRVIRIQILKQKLQPFIDSGSREEAQNLLNKINDQELSFIDAVAHSDDEESKKNQGTIGNLSRDSVVVSEDFTAKIRKLAPSKVSLVTSEFGYHIVQVNIHEETGEKTVSHVLIAYHDADALLEAELKSTQVNIYSPFKSYQSKKIK